MNANILEEKDGYIARLEKLYADRQDGFAALEKILGRRPHETIYDAARRAMENSAAAPDMAEALAAMLEHEGETVADGIGIEHDGPNLQAAKANARALLARINGEGGAK